jgi:hypothetical protein
MNPSDDSGDTGHERLIREMRYEVQQARNRYWEEGVNGGVSTQTHRDLAAKAVEYYDVLYEYREETILDDGDWPNINDLRSRVGKTTEVVSTAGGRGAGADTETVPAVTQVSIGRILQVTKQLDDLAKKLGFSAGVSSRRPLYDVGKRDPDEYDDPVKDGIDKPA